jgi:hypothetical protein
MMALTTCGFCGHAGTHATIISPSGGGGKQRCTGCPQCQAESEAEMAAQQTAEHETDNREL